VLPPTEPRSGRPAITNVLGRGLSCVSGCPVSLWPLFGVILWLFLFYLLTAWFFPLYPLAVLCCDRFWRKT
jgi:hypothetical protein